MINILLITDDYYIMIAMILHFMFYFTLSSSVGCSSHSKMPSVSVAYLGHWLPWQQEEGDSLYIPTLRSNLMENDRSSKCKTKGFLEQSRLLHSVA